MRLVGRTFPRRGQAQTVPPVPARDWGTATKAELMAEADRLGLSHSSRTTKAALVAMIGEATA